LSPSPPGTTLADLLEGVRWDFDPAQQALSPLVATARWFEHFPWDGEEDAAAPLSTEGHV
jgi:hypothetical protein